MEAVPGVLIGDASHPPREVTWWIAKYVPDVDRREPRNTGLILRVAESDALWFRFHPTVFSGGTFSVSDATEMRKGGGNPYYITSEERALHAEQVKKWTEQMEKYGVKCMVWLPSRRRSTTKHFIEVGGSTIKSGRVNFDGLFELLVS